MLRLCDWHRRALTRSVPCLSKAARCRSSTCGARLRSSSTSAGRQRAAQRSSTCGASASGPSSRRRTAGHRASGALATARKLRHTLCAAAKSAVLARHARMYACIARYCVKYASASPLVHRCGPTAEVWSRSNTHRQRKQRHIHRRGIPTHEEAGLARYQTSHHLALRHSPSACFLQRTEPEAAFQSIQVQ